MRFYGKSFVGIKESSVIASNGQKTVDKTDKDIFSKQIFLEMQSIGFFFIHMFTVKRLHRLTDLKESSPKYY